MLNRLFNLFNRNKYLNGRKFDKNHINLLYWKGENVGDYLSVVILEKMLQRKNLTLKTETLKRYSKLSCIGSVIQFYNCDFTIWGSGLIRNKTYGDHIKKYLKLDVRAVRGPLTHKNLIENRLLPSNKKISYGDPAILMPLFYQPLKVIKKYKISIIQHHLEKPITNPNYHFINAKTKDYKNFINEICSSELIISSSLHGIILAESYGVPCVWLKNAEDEFKYLDYYYSTNRKNIVFINDLSEISCVEPMKLPNLIEMQSELIDTFPYDLFKL